MKLNRSINSYFSVTVEAKQLGLRGTYCLGQANLAQADIATIAHLLNETQQAVRIKNSSLASSSILAGFRELHAQIGLSNRKHVSSPESLVKFILAGKSLPSINPIVDIYNIVSLETGLAIGAHDLNRIQGPVKLKLTHGNETFTPLGSEQTKSVAKGEYGYVDEGGNRVICRLETRQCDQTKITAMSQECLFVIQGNEHTSPHYIREAVARLKALLISYGGVSNIQEIFWL